MPTLAAGFKWSGNVLYYHGRSLALDDAQRSILQICDGQTRVRDICVTWGTAQGLDQNTAITDGFKLLKWARSVGIVKRDNDLASPAIFLRIRQLGTEQHRWIYLPPRARRILTLCSGAYSCREMAEILVQERGTGEDEGVMRQEVEEVASVVLFFVAERIACWLDDETSRRTRLEELFEQGG